MKPSRSLVLLELRKRLDSRGSLLGYGLLLVAIVGCAAFSVRLVAAQSEFALGELLVTTALPLALGASLIGVVFGVGEASRGGERDAVLAGISRGHAFAARAAACIVMVLVAVLVTFLVAVAGAIVAVSLGGTISSLSVTAQVVQLLAFTLTSVGFGFGVGAAVRSLAVALVSVLLAVLVLDVALSFVGPWGTFVRFSTLQAGITSEAPLLPTLTSGVLWIAIPVAIGWIRVRRGAL